MSKQVDGDHYSMEIQPVEYITRNKLGFKRGNVVKYVSRDKRKNKDRDIIKSMHYHLLILQHDYKYTNEQINDVLEGLKCTQSK